MDLQEEISKLQQQLADVKSSQLLPGVKADVEAILTQILLQAQAIKPLYDNIDAVRDTIVRPTNDKIKESFESYSKQSKRTNKRNVALSIISIIFGLIGIILTALQIVPARYSPLTRLRIPEGTAAWAAANVEGVIKDFSWVFRIEYPPALAYIKNVQQFNLSETQGVVSLEVYQDYQKGFQFNQAQIDHLFEMIRDFYLSAQPAGTSPSTIRFLSSDYDASIWHNTLRFAVQSSKADFPELRYKTEDGLGVLTLAKSHSIASLGPISSVDFGPNPSALVLEASRVLRGLSGKSFALDLNRTVATAPAALDIYGDLRHIAVFSVR